SRPQRADDEAPAGTARRRAAGRDAGRPVRVSGSTSGNIHSLMPEVQLRGAEVDGLTLHYVMEGRGPAVILVHGLGGFAESWRHNIPALAGVSTVFAVDLPGFGLSSK